MLALACGPGDESSADRAAYLQRAPAAGTEAMADRLARIVARTDPERDGFLSDQRAEIFSARLAAGGMSPQDEVHLRVQLGNELLSSARPRDAIVEPDRARAQAESLGGKASRSMVSAVRELTALAWLRVGEQENCIEHHGSEACLAPIAGKGLHTRREGSEQAVLILNELLEERPGNLAAVWMLNLAHMTLGSWPDGVPEAHRIPAEAFASHDDIGRFTDHAGSWGVDTLGLCGGVAMEDFDRDGDLDLMVTSWSLSDPVQYLRNDREKGFVDATAATGLTGITGGLNLVHADQDNDGLPDVLVLRGAWRQEQGLYPNSLLRNLGQGRFDDVTEAAGLLSFHPTQTAAWGDYDGDGWLDLFVGNESVPAQGQPIHPCELFHNDGGSSFSERALDSGMTTLGYAKGTAFGDVDNDGDVDLYVSMNSGPNLLYRNDGPRNGIAPAAPVPSTERSPATLPQRWSFSEVAQAAGVSEPFASFPCWFFDYDNDGHLDLWLSGYEYGSVRRVARDYLGREHSGTLPRLYRNLGDGRFEDQAEATGLNALLLTMGANHGDLDNDGFEDLYAGTGEPDFMALYPNRMFRNDRGQRFLDVTTSGGFGHLQKGHGVAFGDIDEDGDQDVYAVMGGAFSGDAFRNALFENPGHGRRWISLRLQGRGSNRDGIGSRVEARARQRDGSLLSVHKLVGTGGSFGSQSLQLEIGLGDAVALERLIIRWHGSGTTQEFADLPLDQIITVIEGLEPPQVMAPRPIARPGSAH